MTERRPFLPAPVPTEGGAGRLEPRKYSWCLGYGHEARFGYWLRLRAKNQETTNVTFYLQYGLRYPYGQTFIVGVNMVKYGLKKRQGSIKMAFINLRRRYPMEEKLDAKSVSEKAKGYFGQGYN